MPGYPAQDLAASPPRNFSRPTRSVSVSTVSTQPHESPSEGQPHVTGSKAAYPAYPPPPYSRGANALERDALNSSDRATDVAYVPGNLFGEIVPESRRTSYSSRTLVSQSTRKGSRRKHKPALSIDTNVGKAGSRPKQIKRVARSDSNSRRGTPRQNSVRSTRGKNLVYLPPTTYNANNRSYPRPPSSVYSRAADTSRPTASFAANPLGLQATGFRDSTATNFEEDEVSANKERVRSTATIFEEDQVVRSRSNTDESGIVPTPRRSKGWWNVITTPFQNQKRFTEFGGDEEKVPDVPALPQAYYTKPMPRDVSKTRISPEEVRQYLSSGADQRGGRARQDSSGSAATSIDTSNGEESEQQHNRVETSGGPRDFERATIASQRGTTRFSEFSPDDREVPIMLRRDTADMLPRRSTSSRTANPNHWLANLRASEKPVVSTWSPLTSNQEDSPESEMAHFHSPVVHPVAIGSILAGETRTVHERPQLPIQTAAWRVTRHSPDAFAFKRSSQAAQWDTDSRRTPPTVQYRPDDYASSYDEAISTRGTKIHKPQTPFVFSEPPVDKNAKKEKKQKQKKKKRRCCCICLIILILLLLALGVVVPVVLTRKHHSSTSIWVDLPGFPPMPTGSFTIAQPNMVYNETGCVNPTAMWSCAVPKEEQASIAPNQPDQPDFLFTIYYVNPNSSSPSGTAFQPSPGVPALDEQTFLGNTTDNNAEPFDGVSTPFYISFNPPNSAFSQSSKLRKRQGGSDGTNTTQTQLGSAPTTSSSAPSSTINTIPDLATAIPIPSTNPDGTALPANLLPFPSYEPIRLFNRGLSTEHYGFYTYFDRSIFMKSISIQNSTEAAEGDIPADADGGSTFDGATARCTWADTRFLVQIWTRTNTTLLAKPTGTASAAPAAKSGTAPTFVRPGSMPYPVTITLDRHGGGLTTKMLYCYGLDARGVVDADSKAFQREDRSFGGTLVNPAEGPFTSVNVTTAMGGPGGIDGGTGGCSCKWQNF